MRFSFILTTIIGISSLAMSCNDKVPSADSKQKARPKHGSENPPIDCPLRKAGIKPHDMKPFEDTEKYIAFLEREDRAAWQKPDAIIKTLGLEGKETVSDVGAGSGYFTFRLAGALPHGKVRAIDVEPEMIRHIHHKAMNEGVKNIEVVLATFDDPKVSSSSKLVFICDVLHHVQNREKWLERIYKTLGSRARIALIEFKEGDLPAGPPESLKIPKQEIVALLKKVGFQLTEDHTDLLPYQHFLVFKKP